MSKPQKLFILRKHGFTQRGEQMKRTIIAAMMFYIAAFLIFISSVLILILAQNIILGLILTCAGFVMTGLGAVLTNKLKNKDKSDKTDDEKQE